jgi:hypothetical protein
MGGGISIYYNYRGAKNSRHTVRSHDNTKNMPLSTVGALPATWAPIGFCYGFLNLNRFCLWGAPKIISRHRTRCQ